MWTDLGLKLKTVWVLAPIHSPRSRALAKETPQATILVLLSVCADTYRVRDMTISYVGPISPPQSWTSSAINKPMFWTCLRCFHRRDKTSHYKKNFFSTASVGQGPCPYVPELVCK